MWRCAHLPYLYIGQHYTYGHNWQFPQVCALHVHPQLLQGKGAVQFMFNPLRNAASAALSLCGLHEI